jgi:hypothetical protein
MKKYDLSYHILLKMAGLEKDAWPWSSRAPAFDYSKAQIDTSVGNNAYRSFNKAYAGA